MLFPVSIDIFLLNPFRFPPSGNIEQQNAGDKLDESGGRVN